MAGTIIVDRIESDASYASTINVANRITFSNTVNFGVTSGAPVAGFYSPSTNNLAFTTASTERMRIDNAGNVGIGTSSPASKLHISNAGSVADNCFNVSTPANDNVLLGANLVVDAAGIYTKPATSISGAGILFEGINSLAGHGSIQFLSAPDTNDGSATPLERMRIDSSGNVGIGTSSPTSKLDVQVTDPTNPAGYFYNLAGSSNSPALIARGGANNAGAARIIIAQDNSGNEEFGISGTGQLFINAGFGSSGLGFVCRAWVNFNGTGTPAISASGNISSLTDDGLGRYRLNLITALPDTNFALSGNGSLRDVSDDGNNGTVSIRRLSSVSITTSVIPIQTSYYGANGTISDFPLVSVMVIR